jgi:hypothetical protein
MYLSVQAKRPVACFGIAELCCGQRQRAKDVQTHHHRVSRVVARVALVFLVLGEIARKVHPQRPILHPAQDPVARAGIDHLDILRRPSMHDRGPGDGGDAFVGVGRFLVDEIVLLLAEQDRQIGVRVGTKHRAAALPAVLELRYGARRQIGAVGVVVVHEPKDRELVAIDENPVRLALAASPNLEALTRNDHATDHRFLAPPSPSAARFSAPAFGSTKPGSCIFRG